MVKFCLEPEKSYSLNLKIYLKVKLIFKFVIDGRWEEMEGNKLEVFPRVAAPNGLKIRVAAY